VKEFATMFDLNDVEPPRGGELIPDGAFAKVTMTVRPGGVDGHGDLDRGLLKASNVPGSDVLSLDCEFTVVEGPYARRKFWQSFTVSGGKVDEKGASMGWNITKRILRGMIDSALGLDPKDESDAAKTKRQLRGLADLSGITFVAKILVEPNKDNRYPDTNKLDRPVLPNEKEWQAVMNGEEIPPSPSQRRSASAAPSAPSQTAPAWSQGQPKPATAPSAPAWQRSAQSPVAAEPAAPQPAAASTPAATEGAKPAGPAWLNG
jgi:hypothetical protein